MPRRYADDEAALKPVSQEQPLLDRDGLAVILNDAKERREALKDDLLSEINTLRSTINSLSASFMELQPEYRITHRWVYVQLPINDWTLGNSGYTQTVEIPELLQDDAVFVCPRPDFIDKCAEFNIHCVDQTYQHLIFYASDRPDYAVYINIYIAGHGDRELSPAEDSSF